MYFVSWSRGWTWLNTLKVRFGKRAQFSTGNVNSVGSWLAILQCNDYYDDHACAHLHCCKESPITRLKDWSTNTSWYFEHIKLLTKVESSYLLNELIVIPWCVIRLLVIISYAHGCIAHWYLIFITCVMIFSLILTLLTLWWWQATSNANEPCLNNEIVTIMSTNL